MQFLCAGDSRGIAVLIQTHCPPRPPPEPHIDYKMSISTTYIGTSTCRSVSSAGMASYATTRSARSASTANTPAQVLQTSPVVYDGWKAELSGRIHIYPGRTTDFIDTFVPSSHSYTLTDDVTGAFSQYRSRKGKEVKSYPGLVRTEYTIAARYSAHI